MTAPLTTVARFLPAIPGATQSQLTIVPNLIQAASNIAVRYTNRQFWQADYTEYRDSSLSNSIILRQFPVNQITRISFNLQPVLTITSTNTSYQRALAQLDTSGTLETGLTVNGIRLSWLNSGVAGTTLIDTSTLLTLQSVADAITALGNGWSVNVLAGFSQYPTTDICPIRGGGSCRGTGCDFSIYTQDANNYQVDPGIGEIKLIDRTNANFFAFTSYPWTNSWGNPGYRNIRIDYNAGFVAIPEDVQQAVVLIAQMLYEIGDQTLVTKMVKVFDYQEETDADLIAIPDAAKEILNLYRNFRSSGE
jgi:hypothetical protein